MDFLLPPGYGPVTVLHEVPADYEDYRIPAARPYYVEGGFGHYLTQRVEAAEVGLQLNLFLMRSGFTLDPFTLQSVHPLHYMLEGSVRCELKGFGEAWLHEGKCSLFYVPGGERHHARFRAGFYRSFHVDIPPRGLQNISGNYPELTEVFDRFSSGRGLQQRSASITPPIERMINRLAADCPLSQPRLGIFLQAMAFRLLLWYVQGLPRAERLPPGAVWLMEEVKEDILLRLHEPLTIKSLALRFLLTESTLRRQFLQHFGEPIRHFVLKSRMDRAKVLLDEDMSISDVAFRTGYRDISSFTRAFGHYFGYTPSAYRRR